MKPQDYRVNELLTKVAIGWSNDEYIASRILPTLPVKKRTGIYYKYDKSNLRREKSSRAPGVAANEVTNGLTQITYGPIVEHSLKIKVPVEDAEDVEMDVAKQDGVESVMESIMVDQEAELAAKLADTATVTQNVTLSGTDQWSDYSASNPYTNIKTAIATIVAATGKKPNTVWMNYGVFLTLAYHPHTLSRINGVKVAANESDLATIIGVENVIVSSAVYNGAFEGETDSLGYIWGNHFWVGYINPTAGQSRRRLTIGHTLRVENEAADRTVVDEWYDIDLKAWWERASMNWKQEIMSAECVYVIKSVI